MRYLILLLVFSSCIFKESISILDICGTYRLEEGRIFYLITDTYEYYKLVPLDSLNDLVVDSGLIFLEDNKIYTKELVLNGEIFLGENYFTINNLMFYKICSPCKI